MSATNEILVGIDIVEIDRFERLIKKYPKVIQRLFTKKEQKIGHQSKAQIARLAARFAAKEATMKVLGVGLWAVDFTDIEIIVTENKKPAINLNGRAKKLAEQLIKGSPSVSLSHSLNIAAATVVARKKS
jgi:holo-[acyl-carrier protein] synthase